MHEAVITGLGAVAPNGVGSERFWDALVHGKTGISRVSKFEPKDLPCQIGGEIPVEAINISGVDLPGWLPDSPSCRFAALAAMLALNDADLRVGDLADRHSSVIMGVSTTDMEVLQREFNSFREQGMPREDFMMAAFPYSPAAIVAHLMKSNENVMTISTTCTSGLNSIYYGAKSIINGEADLVVAGGVDTPLSPLGLAGVCAAGMVPTDYNHQPASASRPFDKIRQGGILSEGAGIVILEQKELALRRKAKIYSVFAGGGITNALSPDWISAAMEKAMQKALREAKLKPEEIDYISACAPGDPTIDRLETKAIKELFGRKAYNIPISSLKSMIGNPGAAAGPLQVIAASLSIRDSIIPPTINLEYGEKQCDLDYVPIKSRVARVKRVLINVRGFGGGISSLIIKAHL